MLGAVGIGFPSDDSKLNEIIYAFLAKTEVLGFLDANTIAKSTLRKEFFRVFWHRVLGDGTILDRNANTTRKLWLRSSALGSSAIKIPSLNLR